MKNGTKELFEKIYQENNFKELHNRSYSFGSYLGTYVFNRFTNIYYIC